jgi:hypothetical protein
MESRVERMVKMIKRNVSRETSNGTFSYKACILQNDIKINIGEVVFQ